MNTEPIANRCPRCQAPLPANAPQGLCPKCLLAAAATPTEAGQPADRKPPPALATIATAFPQLEILELIGHGGMGVVYKARQPKLDRLVALKLLPQSLAADAAFAERFNREARVLARLNHPNIVTVYDFGQSGGFFFLLMELVDGVNLRQAMQAGRFTPQQAMMLVPKICEALQFAHDEGILHRDIKPENILLDTRGRVKIADFGIAKLLGEGRENITLTASGLAVGTPHYMAPEQLEHPQEVDQRADIYSLGVVFYEMLTGELPIGRFAPPSQKSSVDARVDEVVFHALEKEREKRFRSAGEVKTSVEAITSNPAAMPGQPAAAQPSPGAPPPERRIPCYISTPEHLRTFTGRFLYIYTGKGELSLNGENLTFVSNWQSTVIPLRDIRELRIGHYSRVAKPLRLDYLAVTFEGAGQRRTLFFTPCIRGGISLPWEVNPLVADCLRAVREAVIARTGQTPGGPSPAGLRGWHPPDALWQAIRIGLPIAAATGAVAVVTMLVARRQGAQATDDSLGGWFIFSVVCGQALVAYIVIRIRLWRVRRDLELKQRTCPSEPPASLLPGYGPSHTTAMPAYRTAGPNSHRASASAPAASESRATCYFNTPARMRDCFPSAAARIFTCKGELALEGESLTFTSTWRTTITIPLKDIEDLSVGQFQMWTTPWVMKYARINFLSVTFRHEGHLQTVHFTPVEPGANTESRINDCVGGWFDRVRQTVIARTGSAPRCTEPDTLTIKAQKAWGRKGWPLYILFMLVWFFSWFVLPSVTHYRVPQPVWTILAIVTGLLAGATLFSAAGFMKADRALKRGDLDAVTSDDPPAPEPAGGGAGRGREDRWGSLFYPALAAGVLLVLIAGWWSYSHKASSPSGDTNGSRLPATGTITAAPETEGRFVLYTMPGTSAPAEPHWKLKYHVPPNHLARVLFVRWTNGVPILDDHYGFSSYFKMGNIFMEGHFTLSCARADETNKTAQVAKQAATRRYGTDAGAPGNDSPQSDIQWTASLLWENESYTSRLAGEPAYRLVNPPAQLAIRPGHQGVYRLVSYLTPQGESAAGLSGIELRIFLEPVNYAPVQTSPSEVEGEEYVIGLRMGWTREQALAAIKEWPIDK